MVGYGAAKTVLPAEAAQQRELGIGVGVESVDADHGRDAGSADGVRMVQQIGAATLQQGEILAGVRLRQRAARCDRWPAAVHFQGANRRHQHGDVGLQAGQAALHVPEFFKADVGGEAGFGHVVVEELEPQTIPDDGGLPDGDIGEGPGVYQHGLVLHRVA